MKRWQRLTALVCLVFLLFSGKRPVWAEGVTALHTSFCYGHSETGRELICHRVGSADAAQSILIVFGVHGYEDAFDRDGEVLMLIAESLITHYTDHAEEIRDYCLYIVPSANPDGLIDGTTAHGFGRCNANGLDINRDFPYDWEKDTSTRNQTGKRPLSTAEARAITELVAQIQPDYGIDVHGWKNASYGNGKMAEFFAKPFQIKVKRLSTEGMLGAWLNSVTSESILLELPSSPNKETYVTENSARLIEGLNDWMEYCQPRSK